MVVIEHDESVLPGNFFYGDIPMEWMGTAIRLPGCGIKLALLIWHYWSLRKSQVRVSMTKCRQIGVGRRARNTALDNMATAGLIEITGYDNKAPIVKVVHRKGQ